MNRYLSILLLLVVFGFISCGSGGEDGDDGGDSSAACNVVEGKIENGSECHVGNSPVVKLILIDSSGAESGLCSGAVLTANAVLTAAHCFLGDVASVRIVTGNGDVNASDLHIHPDFVVAADGTLYNDVAILDTNTSIPARTASLLLNSSASNGEQALIAGYGLDASGDLDNLRAGFTTIGFVDNNFIGYVYSGADSNTCSGDSGGPLFVNRGGNWVVAGTTSAGSATGCGAGDESLYTRLSKPSISQFIVQEVPGASRL